MYTHGMKINDTSWEKVAPWYSDHLASTDTYQEKVIVPNLVRFVSLKKGEKVLDLGCGDGYFTRVLKKEGGDVSGIDASKSLVEKAKKVDPKGNYSVKKAEEMQGVKEKYDTVVSVLAFQNMKYGEKVFEIVKKHLTEKGRFVLVLNHPAFRVPKESDWYFDSTRNEQGRVVYKYMSEVSLPIVMNPGSKKENQEVTYSFQRPMQWYVKQANKNGLALTRMEEWISHKGSQKGPRQKAEDQARKEIPMFMVIEFSIL